MRRSQDRSRRGRLRQAICLVLSAAMLLGLVPGDGLAWAAERDLVALSAIAEGMSTAMGPALTASSQQGSSGPAPAASAAGSVGDEMASMAGDAASGTEGMRATVGQGGGALVTTEEQDAAEAADIASDDDDGDATTAPVTKGPALTVLADPSDGDPVVTHAVTLDLGAEGAALDTEVEAALVAAGFTQDGTTWTGQVVEGATLEETLGIGLGDPAINGDSSTFFGWEVPDVYADTPEKVHTRFVEGRTWEKQPSGAEFMQYANLAPQIDYWGVGRYEFDFDIRSLSTDLFSSINIYMQNGSTARYNLSDVAGLTTSYRIPVTTDYTHQHIVSDISLAHADVAASYLAFYGQYSVKVDGETLRTYNIPFVKNMRVTRVGASSASVAGYPVDRDLAVTARWGRPMWRVVSGVYLRFLTQLEGDAEIGGANALNPDGYASAEELPWYRNRASITTVQFETQLHGIRSMAHWFEGLSRLTGISNLDKLDASQVVDLRSLFDGCFALKTLDLSPLDLSSANGVAGSMENMLHGCRNLTSVILPEVAGDLTGLAFPQYYVHDHPSSGGWMNAEDASTDYLPDVVVDGTLPAGTYVRRMCAMWRLTGDGDAYDGSSATELHLAMQLEDDDDAAAEGWRPIGNAYAWDGERPAWLAHADEIARVILDERVSGLTSGQALFAGLGNVTEFVNLNLLDTSAMTTMRDLFRGDAKLAALSVSTFDTRLVLDMSGMFRGCAALTEIDVASFLKNLYFSDVSYMFADCVSLRDPVLGSIVASGVRDVSGMFLNCSSLTELDLTLCYFSSNLHDSVDVLKGCSSLTRILLPAHSVYGGNNAVPPLTTWFRFPEVTLLDEPCHWVWQEDSSVSCAGGAQVVMPLDNEVYGTWTREEPVPVWRLRGAGDNEPGEGIAPAELHLATAWAHAVGAGGWESVAASHDEDSLPAWHAAADSITTVTLDAPVVGVTSAAWWFARLDRLSTVTRLDRLDTSALASLAHLFDGCSSLTVLDLSGLDVSGVSDMGGMLDGCDALTSIVFDVDGSFAAAGDGSAVDAGRFHFPSYVADGYSGRWASEGDASLVFAPTDDMAGVTLSGTYVRQPSAIAVDLAGGSFTASEAATMGALPRFTFDSGVPAWEGTAPGAATLAEAIGGVLFTPARAGFLFMGWTVPVWHSDRELTGTSGTLSYADLASTFARWGTGRYVVEFDVRLAQASAIGTVSVDLAGTEGGPASYAFMGGTKLVSATATYTRRRVEVEVVSAGVAELPAILCFADAAGGHSPTVTDVTVSRRGLTSERAGVVETTHDVDAEAEWAVPAWRLTGADGAYDGVAATELHFSMQHKDGDGNLPDGWAEVSTGAYTPDSRPPWYGARVTVTKVAFDTRVIGITSLAYWFDGFVYLTQVEQLSNLDTSAVTSFVYSFINCRSLTELDLSGLDLSRLANVDAMVASCVSLRELDFSGLSAPALTRVSYCASGCSALERVVLPVAPAVREFSSVFDSCRSLREVDLSGIRLTSGAVSLKNAFCNCASLESVSLPDASAVTSLETAFMGCSSLRKLDLSRLDLASRSVNLSGALSGCSALELVELPEVSAANGAVLAFPTYKALGRVTSGRWCNVDVPDVTYAAEEPVGTALVAGTYGWAATAMWRLTGDGNVTLAEGDVPTELHFAMQPVGDEADGWAEVGNHYSYNGQAAGTTRAPWYGQAGTITKVVMDNYVRGLTSTNGLFSNLSRVTEYVHFDWFDTGTVTDMRNMFLANSRLRTIDLSAFDTSRARDMAGLFQNCSQLMEVDLSDSAAPQLVDTLLMFGNCTSLASVRMGGLVTSTTTNLSSLFLGCSNLVELDLSACDLSGGSAATIIHLLDGCVALERLELPAGAVSDFRFPALTLGGVAASWTNVDDLEESFVSGVTLGALSFQGGTYVRDRVVSTYRLTGSGGANLGVGEMPIELHLKSQLAGSVADGWGVMADSYGEGESLPPWHDHAATLTQAVFDDVLVGATSTARWFYGLTQLSAVEGIARLNTAKVEDMSGMFSECSSLASLDVSGLRTSRVTTMADMFYGCASLTALDVSRFDTSQVTDLGGMFNGCARLGSLDVSRFDTSRVTNIGYMFRYCESLSTVDVSRWDTRTVTSMECVFNHCHGLRSVDVSGWDTSRVTSMLGMFYSCGKLETLDVSGFVTDQVRDLRSMFCGCGLLAELDVSGFSNASATSLYYLFSGCRGLAYLDLSGFDARAVTDMQSMLSGCTGLVSVRLGGNFSFAGGGIADESKRTRLPEPTDTATYTDRWRSDDAANGTARTATELAASYDGATMAGTWTRVTRLEGTACAVLLGEGSTVAVPAYGVTPTGAKIAAATTYVVGSEVADEVGYRAGTLLFLRGLGTVPASGATAISDLYGTRYEGVGVFGGVESYAYDGGAVDIASPPTPWGAARVDIRHVDVASDQLIRLHSIGGLFAGLFAVTSIDLVGLDVSQADTLAYLFAGCESLVELDAPGLAALTPGSLCATFMGCASLTKLDLSDWDLSEVTSAQDLFAGCSSLGQVDLPGPLAPPLNNASRMFAGCAALTAIDVAGWDMSEVTRLDGMFDGCRNLTSLDLSGWDAPKLTDASAFARDCASLTTLDLSGLGTTRATDLGDLLAGCAALTRVSFDGDDGFAADGDAIAATADQFHFPGYEDATSTGRWVSETDAYESYVTDAAADMAGVVLRGAYVRQVAIPVWRLTAAGGTYDGSSAVELHFAMGGVSHEEGWEPIANNYTWSGATGGTTTTPWLAKAATITKVVLDGRVTGLTSGRALFYGLVKVSDFVDLPLLDTSRMTTLTDMFSACRSATSIDISGFDTSSARDLRYLFQNCASLREVDVSHLDVGLVRDVFHMFEGCSQLERVTLGSVITSLTTNVSGMFVNCSQLATLDLSACDLSGVTNGTEMLLGCGSLTRIALPASAARGASLSWFRFPSYASGTTHTGLWARDDGLDGAAYGAESDIAGVTLTGSWVRQPVASAYAVLGADGTLTFFRSHNTYADGAASFTDAHDVTHDAFTDLMGAERAGTVFAGFEDASAFAAADDVPWDAVRGRVTAVSFLDGQVVAPKSIAWWFEGCGALASVSGLTSLDTAGVTSMAHAFDGCSQLARLDVTSLSTGSVRSMESLFAGCSRLAALEVSGFDMADVVTIAGMFSGCAALRAVDVAAWNTSGVVDMGSAFRGCESLTELDLSTWDTSSLTKLQGTFRGCSGLRSIVFAPGVDTSGVTDMAGLFLGCGALAALDLSGFDTSAAQDMGGMFSGADALSSVTFGAGFSFKGAGTGAIATEVGRQALLATPVASGRRTGKWMRVGDDAHAWSAEALRDGGAVPAAGTYVWELGCIVTYDAGGTALSGVGTPSPASLLVSHGDTLEAPELAAPVGYALEGWYTDSGAGTRVVFAGGTGTTTTVTGDLALTARYLPLRGFVVRFAPNAAGAVSAEPDVTHLDRDVTNLPADLTGLSWESDNLVGAAAADDATALGQAPTLAGYRFVGWYLADGTTLVTKGSAYGTLAHAMATRAATAAGAGDDPTAPGATPLSEITLYAHWEVAPDAGQAYAVLSDDGTLTFFRSERSYQGGREYGAGALSDLAGTSYGGFVWGGFESTQRFDAVRDLPWARYLNRVRVVSVARLDVGEPDGRRQLVAPRSMAHWFEGATSLVELDLAGFDTSRVTSMAALLKGCSSIASAPAFEGVETDVLTDMTELLRDCSALTSVDFEPLDTARVTGMGGLLRGCSSLEAVDLASLDTSAATDLSSIVEGCASLRLLSLGAVGSTDFDTGSAADLSRMFAGCTRLGTLDIAAMDTSAAHDLSGMFDGCDTLRRVTLGTAFGFSGGDGTAVGTLPASRSAVLPEPPNDGIYAGTWESLEGEPFALSALELADSYVGARMAGTWEWGFELPVTGGSGESVALMWAAAAAVAIAALLLRRRRLRGDDESR